MSSKKAQNGQGNREKRGGPALYYQNLHSA